MQGLLLEVLCFFYDHMKIRVLWPTMEASWPAAAHQWPGPVLSTTRHTSL
jgi:hypothetical protein